MVGRRSQIGRPCSNAGRAMRVRLAGLQPRCFGRSVLQPQHRNDFGQGRVLRVRAYDGAMHWPQINHIQLLRYAGLFQYASVGTPFLRYGTVVEDLAAKQLPASYVHLWLGCYIVFGVVYWYLTSDLGARGRTPLRRGVQVQQAELPDPMADPARGEGIGVEHRDLDRRDRARRPRAPLGERVAPGHAVGRPLRIFARKLDFCGLGHGGTLRSAGGPNKRAGWHLRDESCHSGDSAP